jgi:ABC-2 type transport system permease protein
MLTLIGRSLGRTAPTLGALLALLVGFQMLLVVTAASYAQSNDFAAIAKIVPAFLQQTFGAALLSFASMVTIGYFEPLIVILVVVFAVYLATEPAGEIESGLVDLVLARPLPRHRLVSRSLLMMASCTALLTLTMTAALWLALWLFAPASEGWPENGTVTTLAVHLTAIAWCFGGVALFAGASARRRSSAVTAVSVGAVALYLLELVGGAWAPMRRVATLSPFHYFQGSAILAGEADVARNLFVLGAIAIAASGLAYWRFERRDL